MRLYDLDRHRMETDPEMALREAREWEQCREADDGMEAQRQPGFWRADELPAVPHTDLMAGDEARDLGRNYWSPRYARKPVAAERAVTVEPAAEVA